MLGDTSERRIAPRQLRLGQKVLQGQGLRCEDCGRMYSHQPSLWKHRRFECNKEPQFCCSYCPYRAKRRTSVVDHTQRRHPGCAINIWTFFQSSCNTGSVFFFFLVLKLCRMRTLWGAVRWAEWYLVYHVIKTLECIIASIFRGLCVWSHFTQCARWLWLVDASVLLRRTVVIIWWNEVSCFFFVFTVLHVLCYSHLDSLRWELIFLRLFSLYILLVFKQTLDVIFVKSSIFSFRL